MTEPSSEEDGNYLVRVRAQVMTRDDSTGGWVPLSGGGLAYVSVRRRPIVSTSTQTGTTNGTSTPTTTVIAPSPSITNSVTTTTNSQGNGSSSTSPPSVPKRMHEYLIFGKKNTDESVVLNCTIKKDFEYNKVMPTFHHWRTGEKKFGLTFQTAADARAFDKGVRTAVEELLEGLAEQSSLSDEYGQADGSDDDVFMTLDLPVKLPEPRQSTELTQRGVVQMPNYHSQYSDPLDPHNRPIHCISEPSIVKMPPHHHPLESGATDLTSDNYPYVHLTTLNHDCLYPVVNEQQQHNIVEQISRSNSSGSLKKPDIIASQPAKAAAAATADTRMAGRGNLRLLCKHCHELYTEQQNRRGTCEFAPDPVMTGIATISCLSCADCMLYHCISEADDDYYQNPCSCRKEEGYVQRWLSVGLLSIVMPCLCLYPPLKLLHWFGVQCGICGGQHEWAE